VTTVKKYHVPYRIDVYQKGKTDAPVFTAENDLRDQDVLLEFPVGAIGDTIAWFSYAERFQKKHGCRMTISMAKPMADLFRRQYPEMRFIEPEEAQDEHPYATYRLGLYFGGDTDHQPYDFRKIGLHHTIGYMLGLDDEIGDEPPRVDLSHPRQIKEKYAVISAKASSQCKMWNNPQGWRETIKALKDNGYRVLCIDREQETGAGVTWNSMPYGAEDFTGDRPLQERIDLIKDADVFIGLSSGLSWLAWCCRVPIVMISGFTEPWNEFKCHRVINTHVCHGCWNDTRCEFDHHDYLWCPFKKDDAGKFECTKAITSKMVLDAVAQALEDRE
jgi:autotransporter strand-loop-strand O-heptosyltransferase